MKTMLLGVMLFTSLTSWAQKSPDYYETNNNPVLNQRQSQDIRVWCQDRLRTLRQARRDARFLNYQGLYEQAIIRIKAGLQTAYRDIYSSSNTPISQQLLLRGIRLATTLSRYISYERNGFKAVSYFLDKYILYIENAMINIDIPYYQPGNCGYCSHRDNRDFEESLIKLARLKLELVNDTLIFSQRVVPIGPTALYLKASEILSYYSKVDLENSLFANYYACQIRDLNEIHHRLLIFNDQANAHDTKRMVYQTFYAIEEVIRSLNIDRRCY